MDIKCAFSLFVIFSEGSWVFGFVSMSNVKINIHLYLFSLKNLFLPGFWIWAVDLKSCLLRKYVIFFLHKKIKQCQISVIFLIENYSKG